MSWVYLDHNATTPLDPAVRQAMEPFLAEDFGNPSSIHALGRRARAALDDFRDRLARHWHCRPSELVFTSGGTEANNHAILGAARSRKTRGRHLITSAVEHPSVLQPLRHLAVHEGYDLTIVGTDPFGYVDPEEIRAALRTDTILVSIMAANNEVGTLQPVAAVGHLLRDRDVLFHTDASQWFGKEPMAVIADFAADLVTVCAHKLYGPKGAGALYVRSPLLLPALLLGGSQENEHRAGTENLAAIAGLVTCLERFSSPPVMDRRVLAPLTARLETAALAIPGAKRWGADLPGRLSNTLALTLDGCDSLSLLAGLDLEGICASSGSACSSGSLEPSPVLRAMGATPAEASGLLRFSLGRDHALADIDRVAASLAHVVERVRN